MSATCPLLRPDPRIPGEHGGTGKGQESFRPRSASVDRFRHLMYNTLALNNWAIGVPDRERLRRPRPLLWFQGGFRAARKWDGTKHNKGSVQFLW